MSNQESPGACDSKPSSLLDLTGRNQELLESYLTRWKVIGSGKCIEVYEFEDPIRISPPFLRATRKVGLNDEDEIDVALDPNKIYLHKQPDRSEEYKKRNLSRTKNKVRRLVQENFDKAGKLLTLTFKDTSRFDIQSLTDCYARFEYFLKKTRHTYRTVKYVAVPEFQDANGRGAVHYHLIVDLPYVPVERLRRLWRFGFIKINLITNHDFVGAYIAKYFVKSAKDERFKDHRMFYASRNLRKPEIMYGDYLQDKIVIIEEKGFKPVYSNTYFSEWCGEIKYRQYNLYQRPAQKQESNGSD